MIWLNHPLPLFILLSFGSQIRSDQLAIVDIEDKVPALTITNDGPALLDANITFFAKLKNAAPNETYSYEFKDNLKQHHAQTLSCYDSCNYTTSYPFERYNYGTYIMNVRVMDQDKKLVSKGNNSFELTRSILGKIVMTQNGKAADDALIVGDPVSIGVQFHDPEGFLKNRTITYIWSLEFTTVAYTKSFNYTFKNATTAHVSVALFVEVTQTHLVSNSFYRQVAVLSPIKVQINGSSVLKFGQVLHKNVTCTGSGAFSYCWEIFHQNETVPAKFECKGPVVTNVCQFPVIRYLRKSGSYTFIVKISNSVSSQTTRQEISILDETKESQLSTLLIPVVCSVLAIAIIVWGIGYFVHTRNRYKIEVADFDFQFNASEYTFRTFFQRLRDSIVTVVGCSRAADDTNVPSSSSPSPLSVEPINSDSRYDSKSSLIR